MNVSSENPKTIVIVSVTGCPIWKYCDGFVKDNKPLILLSEVIVSFNKSLHEEQDSSVQSEEIISFDRSFHEGHDSSVLSEETVP